MNHMLSRFQALNESYAQNPHFFCHFLQLFTWGWNQRGTLGHPQESKIECLPSQVEALSHVKIVQVSDLILAQHTSFPFK